MMTFKESVKKCMLKKYGSPDGRASRAEFWWFVLFLDASYLLLLLISGIIGAIADDMDISATIFMVTAIIFLLATFIPYICVFFRRLHDRGRDGSLFIIACFTGLVLIIYIIPLSLPSKEGENKYGPNPNDTNYKNPIAVDVPLGEDENV